MPTYDVRQVITLYQQGTSPLYYGVLQGSYNRTWERYFSSQPIAFGTTRINGVDNGPGVNQYTMSLIVTDWASDSLPYQQGVTQTWDVQKYNLEEAFKVTGSPLVFYDPFNQPPTLTPSQSGIYFWKFEEIIRPESTPQKPVLQYDVTFTESPPGITL